MHDNREREKTPKKEGKKHPREKTSQIKSKEAHLVKKLQKAEKEIEMLNDRLLRIAAELDNFRKRTEREVSQIVQNANASLLKDILPVVDDLERSLKNMQNRGKAGEFRKGVELIFQKLMSILQMHGLQAMESVGRPFDVEYHDALLQVVKEGTPPGMVVEEHEKGYLLNGRVLRHAKVLVSK